MYLYGAVGKTLIPMYLKTFGMKARLQSFIFQPLPTLHAELTKTNRQGKPDGQNVNQSLVEGSVENAATTEGCCEVISTKTRPTDGNKADDPVICKLEPFNICYRLDRKGNMHPIGDRRPVRLIRVY